MRISADARYRIGVVIPSVNTAIEEWFPRVAPSGVSIHVSRVPISSAATTAAVEEMAHHEVSAIKLVAHCAPHVILHGCMAASVMRGPALDEAFAQEMARTTGTRFCTAAAAIRFALESFGAQRVCIASPYTEALDTMEQRFFEASGLQVAGTASLGITDTQALGRQSAAELVSLARRAWVPGSDALLISCLALRSHLVIEALEKELNAPVITATQAALWAGLRLAGVDGVVSGYGGLLARQLPRSASTTPLVGS